MANREPNFLRRQLGARLLRLRKQAGKTRADVEAAAVVVESTLWRIEEGRTLTTWMTVQQLCQLYGADELTTKALVELAKAAKDKSWVEAYDDVVPQALQLYVGFELAAEQISIYNPEIIPGALQTEAYARAIFAGEGESAPSVDRLWQVRLERQERFWAGRPAGAGYCAVINQAALDREVTDRVSMGRQVDHMTKIGGRGNIDIRVLCWSAGAHPAIYGGYTIFEFLDEEDPPVVYAENYKAGQYRSEKRDVARMLAIQKMMSELAIPIKEYA